MISLMQQVWINIIAYRLLVYLLLVAKQKAWILRGSLQRGYNVKKKVLLKLNYSTWMFAAWL